jgi:membrane protein involved in colicin uptake
MAKSNSPKSTEFYTPMFAADGRKLSKAERRAANKAKWAAEQAAKRKASKSKKKSKAKKAKAAVAPAPAPSKTAHRTNLEQWLKDNPNRQTMKLGEFEQLGGRTKMAKRLDRKGRTDSGLSKRNNRLEVQAQYKGGTLS